MTTTNPLDPTVQNERQRAIDEAYAADGRHDPEHSSHGLYTGLVTAPEPVAPESGATPITEQPSFAIHSKLKAALSSTWSDVVAAMQQHDLPEQLPDDHHELESSNPELHRLVSYACFIDLALRDLADGGLDECQDTYEMFCADEYLAIRQWPD